MNCRQKGRSARKRAFRQTKCEVEGVADGEKFRAELQNLPAPEAADLARSLLDRVQQEVLEKYRRDLQRIASRLNTETAWAFLDRHLDEATRLGLDGQLKEMVLDSAGHFANPCMLRLTARYGRR